MTKRWLRRYGPAELFALLGAATGYLLVHTLTGSATASAYGAAVGENLAYYGVMMARNRSSTLRALAIEFGPAEILDTAVVRPACIALATSALGPAAGVIVGKFVADLAFYAPVIATYELRTRRRVAR